MRCRFQFLGRGLFPGVLAVATLWTAGCGGGQSTGDASPGTVAAAGGASAKPPAGAPAPEPGAVVDVEGKLLHLELEGGFWGIVTGKNEKLRLVSPPPEGWTSGTSVKARVRRLPAGPSLQQWGVPVELLALARGAPAPRTE
jgi:hypothetical protein